MISAFLHFLVERKKSSHSHGVAHASFKWGAKSGQRLQDVNETRSTTLSPMIPTAILDLLRLALSLRLTNTVKLTTCIRNNSLI